jgi:Uma2 family endonuclease
MTIAPPPSPETQLLTYEQYVDEFMNERPTLQPYAIIEGVRTFMNSPPLIHQRIIIRLIALLLAYEEAHHSGIVVACPIDVVIRRVPKLQARQPDVLFITNARLEQAGGVRMEGPIEAAPELVIEVLSGRKRLHTVQEKLEDYRSIGVEEAWLVSSEAETVQILRLSAEGTETVAVYANGQTLQSRVFPDLTMALADIFVC